MFGVVSALTTPGDAARTAQDIAASEGLFRLGIAGLIVVVILDIVAAAALYTLFEPVNRTVSVMAAGSRITYSAVYLVAIIQLVIALGALGDPDRLQLAINAYQANHLSLRPEPPGRAESTHRRAGGVTTVRLR